MSSFLKRIWVVSELYYPEDTSTGYFLTKIAEGLAQKFSVSVLCAQPTYSRKSSLAPAQEIHNGVEIYRCWSTLFDKNALVLRLFNLITISMSIFFRALFRIQRGDVVLVVTNPPTLPFAVALACWLRRVKYLLLVHDVYPEVLVVTNMIGPHGLSARIGYWLNRILYQRSDRIVVLGRDMEALVASKLKPEARSKIQVITNWADVKGIVPEARSGNMLLKELSLLNKFVIQYSGNIGRTHGIETILEAAKHLQLNKDIHFLVIGSGAKRELIKDFVSQNNLENLTLLQHQPRENLKSTLNACDVSLISFKSGMAGISVPSRLYNVMASAKAIIAVADDGMELATVVKEEKIGWVVPPGNAKALIDAVLEARANPELLVAMGQRARHVAENKYSMSRIIDSFYRLLVNTLP